MDSNRPVPRHVGGRLDHTLARGQVRCPTDVGRSARTTPEDDRSLPEGGTCPSSQHIRSTSGRRPTRWCQLVCSPATRCPSAGFIVGCRPVVGRGRRESGSLLRIRNQGDRPRHGLEVVGRWIALPGVHHLWPSSTLALAAGSDRYPHRLERQRLRLATSSSVSRTHSDLLFPFRLAAASISAASFGVSRQYSLPCFAWPSGSGGLPLFGFLGIW